RTRASAPTSSRCSPAGAWRRSATTRRCLSLPERALLPPDRALASREQLADVAAMSPEEQHRNRHPDPCRGRVAEGVERADRREQRDRQRGERADLEAERHYEPRDTKRERERPREREHDARRRRDALAARETVKYRE